jgi:hypothetical protein
VPWLALEDLLVMPVEEGRLWAPRRPLRRPDAPVDLLGRLLGSSALADGSSAVVRASPG